MTFRKLSDASLNSLASPLIGIDLDAFRRQEGQAIRLVSGGREEVREWRPVPGYEGRYLV